MILDYLVTIHLLFVVIGIVLTVYHNKGHYTDIRFYILLAVCFVPVLTILATINTIED